MFLKLALTATVVLVLVFLVSQWDDVQEFRASHARQVEEIDAYIDLKWQAIDAARKAERRDVSDSPVEPVPTPAQVPATGESPDKY